VAFLASAALGLLELCSPTFAHLRLGMQTSGRSSCATLCLAKVDRSQWASSKTASGEDELWRRSLQPIDWAPGWPVGEGAPKGSLPQTDWAKEKMEANSSLAPGPKGRQRVGRGTNLFLCWRRLSNIAAGEWWKFCAIFNHFPPAPPNHQTTGSSAAADNWDPANWNCHWRNCLFQFCRQTTGCQGAHLAPFGEAKAEQQFE